MSSPSIAGGGWFPCCCPPDPSGVGSGSPLGLDCGWCTPGTAYLKYQIEISGVAAGAGCAVQDCSLYNGTFIVSQCDGATGFDPGCRENPCLWMLPVGPLSICEDPPGTHQEDFFLIALSFDGFIDPFRALAVTLTCTDNFINFYGMAFVAFHNYPELGGATCEFVAKELALSDSPPYNFTLCDLSAARCRVTRLL